MNAMEHGNEYRPDRPVSIRVLRSADRLRVQVTDRGDAGEIAERGGAGPGGKARGPPEAPRLGAVPDREDG